MRSRTAPGSVDDVEAGDRRAAARRCEQRAQHAHGGRLARAVGAEEAVDLAGRDVEVDAVHGLDVAELAYKRLRNEWLIAHRLSVVSAGTTTRRGIARELSAARQLLECPPVAVGVGEVHELTPRELLHVADTSTPRPASSSRAASTSATTSCRPRTEPGRGVDDADADRDRARRTGRRAAARTGCRRSTVASIVGVEADLLDVERLGAVDVGHGQGDELELQSIRYLLRSRIDWPTRPTVRAIADRFWPQYG